MNTMLRNKSEQQLGVEMLLWERLQHAKKHRPQLPCDKGAWTDTVNLEPKLMHILKCIKEIQPASAREISVKLGWDIRRVSSQLQRLKALDEIKTDYVEYVEAPRQKKKWKTHFYVATGKVDNDKSVQTA